MSHLTSRWKRCSDAALIPLVPALAARGGGGFDDEAVQQGRGQRPGRSIASHHSKACEATAAQTTTNEDAMSTRPSTSAAAPPHEPLQRARLSYVKLLNGAFAVFSSTRLVSYLPNIWAIHTSGDSSQHSLWTWLTWLCSHAVMAAWLYEDNGRRANKAMVVTVGNALMCLVTSALIVWYR